VVGLFEVGLKDVFPGGDKFGDVKSIDDLLQVALGVIDNKSLLFLTEGISKIHT